MLGLLKRVFGVIRDTWLVLGIALALLAMAEVAYRAQGAVRSSVRIWLDETADPAYPGNTELFPYHDEEWYEPWVQQRDLAFQVDFVLDPYRGRRMGQVSAPGLNVDSAGHRVTPGGEAARPTRLVLLTGGSAMWGHTVRDSATIPSAVTAVLRAQGHDSVTVRNVAQSGYHLRQELVTVEEFLREGVRPDLVVFMDGINEVGPYFNGEPLGGVYSYRDLVRRVGLGSRGMGREALGLGRHLQLVQRLGRIVTPPADEPRPLSWPEACERAADNYVFYARRVIDLGERYGFAPVFVLQPSLATTGKQLGPWEQYLMDRDRDSGFPPLLQECARVFSRRLASEQSIPWASLIDVFDGVGEDVFIDQLGHTTEDASSRLADALVPVIEARLGAGDRSVVSGGSGR